MKKAIMKTTTVFILFATLFVFGTSQTVIANTVNEIIEVSFLNKVNNKPLFQMNLNNVEPGAFLIKIKDGFDNTLHSEMLKGRKIGKNYLLDVEEADFNNADFKLVFEITNVKTNQTFVYTVTKSTRYVEDILVAKI